MELPKVLSTFLPLTSRPSVWLSVSHSKPRIRKYLKRIKHLNSTQNISYFCGYLLKIFVILQFSSVVSNSLQLHGPEHTRIPVHHQLPGFTQTHVHWVGDAIQPSHPLLSPSPPAFNLSQQKCLFQWVSSSYQVVKVLKFQCQHQFFQWIFKTDFLYDWLVGFPCSPRDSQESSPTPQFKSINSSVLISTQLFYSPTRTFVHDYSENHSFD